MAKTDARVRYTHKVIKDSLLKLLAEKPIKEITVKEICELAEINRATFYTHYHDPYDLLEQIENELFEDISSRVTLRPEDSPNIIRELIPVIEKNIDFARVLFSENGDKMFLRRIMDMGREKQLAAFRDRYPQASELQLNYMYEFIVSGSIAVAGYWVRSGEQHPPLELGKVIKRVSEIWLQELAGE
jgi:AcrR family transcriptional regulator